MDTSTVSRVCWVDLGAPDVDAAADFYAALLGWEITPADPGRYRIALLDGHAVAALGPAEDPGPPYWTVYASTVDAAATTERVGAAGGTVVAPPTAAGEAGVSAVVRGPSGVRLSLWQAGTQGHTWSARIPGTFAGAHLRSEHPALDADFLHVLLGWERTGGSFTHHDEPVASWARATTPAPASGSPWLVGFHVDDVEAAVERAGRLGAQPAGDELGVLVDPVGAVFSLHPAGGRVR